MDESTTLQLKPADGQRVRDPLTGQLLNVSGETKPRNSYWLRRLQEGSVERVQSANKPARPTANKPQESE